MIHELKTWPQYFLQVSAGTKKFELRKNDRGFKVGDEVLLKEFVPAGYYEDEPADRYTGNILHRKIDYIFHGEGTIGLSEGYVILSLSKI